MSGFDNIKKMMFQCDFNNHSESWGVGALGIDVEDIPPAIDNEFNLFLQVHSLTGKSLDEISYDNMVLNLKSELLSQAVKKHGVDNVTPCGNKKSLSECYTIESDHIVLWFNVGRNTFIVKKDFSNN